VPVRRNLGRGFCVTGTRLFKRGWVSQKACGARLLLDKLIPGAHNRGVSEVKASHFAHDRLVRLSSSLRNDLQFASYTSLAKRWNMFNMFWNICRDEEGQDIAEYAVMLAVILVLVVGTIRLVGSNANNVFSSAASSIQ
jgi:Flp pilus assembly pilin Flp